MEPTDEFFSGNRYAIFGVTAPGRMQGKVLVDALAKAGKTAVAIEPSGAPVRNAEVIRTLAEAGHVDGVVLLPPAPWNDAAARFTTDAVQQCREHGISQVWLYTAGDASAAIDIARKAGLDPSSSRCPCLYIAEGGFPHNLHRFIARLLRQI